MSKMSKRIQISIFAKRHEERKKPCKPVKIENNPKIIPNNPKIIPNNPKIIPKSSQSKSGEILLVSTVKKYSSQKTAITNTKMN